MNRFFNIISTILFNLLIVSCTEEPSTVDNGDGIKIEFVEGLNDNSTFTLTKDSNGLYEMILNPNTNQTPQRISAKLTRYDEPITDEWSGSQPKKVSWESNLYWWIGEYDTIVNITESYFNPYTGEIQFINLPPLINWREVIVPTINPSSYTDENTGIANTVIAPIYEMKGDTMKIIVKYYHSSSNKIFKDSTLIILK